MYHPLQSSGPTICCMLYNSFLPFFFNAFTDHTRLKSSKQWLPPPPSCTICSRFGSCFLENLIHKSEHEYQSVRNEVFWSIHQPPFRRLPSYDPKRCSLLHHSNYETRIYKPKRLNTSKYFWFTKKHGYFVIFYFSHWNYYFMI